MGQEHLHTMFSNAGDMHALVGREVRYLGADFYISDILLAEDMLVLTSNSDTQVQNDSFGRATRMVPKDHRLKFRDPDGNPTVIWDELTFLDGAL